MLGRAMLTLASTRGASMLPAFLLMPPSTPLWFVHAFVQAVYSAQTPICQLYVSWHPFAWATCATWDSHLFAYSLLFFDSLIFLLLVIWFLLERQSKLEIFMNCIPQMKMWRLWLFTEPCLKHQEEYILCILYFVFIAYMHYALIKYMMHLRISSILYAYLGCIEENSWSMGCKQGSSFAEYQLHVWKYFEFLEISKTS